MPPGGNRSLHMSGYRTVRYYDWLERACVLGLYGWLVARFVVDYFHTHNAGIFILLASEGLVVLFLAIRRPTNHLSLRPRDWLLAAAATLLPLLVAPTKNEPWLPASYTSMLMVSGLIVQMSAKVALGRSFGCVPAHRGLKLRGPYRYLRHPIYAGYLIFHVGVLLMFPSLWNLSVYFVAYSIQVPRLLAEERLLSLDPRYQKYMATVRYRLLPGVY